MTRTDFRFSAELEVQGRRDLAIAGSALGCLAAAVVTPQGTIEDGPVVCPFRLATGLPCPGCGLARSWVALAHGDLDTALARHAFGPLLLVLALVAIVTVGHRFLRRRSPVDLAGLVGSRVGIGVAIIWCTAWLGALLA